MHLIKSEVQDLAHGRRFDRLVVWEMSRLTRRGIGPLLSLLNEFGSYGVEVVSLREPYLSTEGPTRDLLIAILGWVSKWERDRISARTKSKLSQLRGKTRLGQPQLCECGHRRKSKGRLVHVPACSLCGCVEYRPRKTLLNGGLVPLVGEAVPI